jgi:hypothetical protein
MLANKLFSGPEKSSVKLWLEGHLGKIRRAPEKEAAKPGYFWPNRPLPSTA